MKPMKDLTDQEKASVIEQAPSQALQVLFSHPNIKSTLLNKSNKLPEPVVKARDIQKKISQLNRMITSFERRKGFGIKKT